MPTPRDWPISAFSCFDIEKMIEFYTTVFNLQLTDRGVGFTFPFPLAFMSARPDQHHQLALARNRPAGATSTIMQISFKVDTLAELRVARRRALDKGATMRISAIVDAEIRLIVDGVSA